MNTTGYGLVQIPVFTHYRVCCIRRTLAGGVTSTAWQQIIVCAVRILLLSSWGLKSIDYSLPQTAQKIVGVYIEFALLSLQILNGIVILIGLWGNNVRFLYPALIIIPFCFITDMIVKGTCYADLFLTPEVTSFGILSLIEVWFRGLSLMYGWLIVISFIYYKRKDWRLTEIEIERSKRPPDHVSMIVRRTSIKSPFSRHSSLSLRGRRSFLLRKARTEENEESKIRIPSNKSATSENFTMSEDDAAPLRSNFDENSKVVPRDSSFAQEKCIRNLEDDAELKMLLYDSKTRNSHRRDCLELEIAGSQPVDSTPKSPRSKKRGDFIPEVLLTRNNLELSNKARNLRKEESSDIPIGDSHETDESLVLSITSTSSKESHPILGSPRARSYLPNTSSFEKRGKETKNCLGWSRTVTWAKVQKEATEGTPTKFEKKHIPSPVLV